ncbi:MAG: hypothetical protein Q4D85_11305 [Corynebacterium sp.]|uniref:hypothetical protein n=1 Tax=Corynebacterium sp. TaxID=1720 RepID=UPI0026DD523D|nr:hypothetical protein [Corynebacterium sp.]MDO5099322.1 hypothetical protein [Corynebacterium sp.]
MHEHLINTLAAALPKHVKDAANKVNIRLTRSTMGAPNTYEVQQDMMLAVAARNIHARDDLIDQLGHALSVLHFDYESTQDKNGQLKSKIDNQRDELSKIIEERKTLQIEIRNIGKRLTVWHQRQAKAQKALDALREKHPEVDYTDLADALSLTLEEHVEPGSEEVGE